jgi:enoyl-CoA hydratase/carnithine racemase
MTTVQVSSPRSGVVLVTLDRPDRLNAMSHELVADLHRAFDGVAADGGTRADRLGLVSRVVEDRPVVDAALDVADEILGLRRDAATQVRGSLT